MAGESTLELVTGYRGKAHVTADDARALNAGIVGSGTYVLPEGNSLAAEMVDSNTLRVQSGTLLIQGCQCRVRAGEYVDVKIRNGSQAMKRNDIVVARWEKQAAEPRTESVELKVIEGTPSSGAAEDPAHTEGDLSSDLVAEFPLWRIPLDGITVGTPVPLYKKLVSVDALGDSVSPVKTYTGTKVISFSSERHVLFEVNEQIALFGRALDKEKGDFIGVMNGDEAAVDVKPTATLRDGRAIVVLDRQLTGPARINYAAVLGV